MPKMKVFDFNVDTFNLSTGEVVHQVHEVNRELFEIENITEHVSIDKYGRVFYRDKIIRLFV
jgi:hypothetical protein